MESIGSYLKRQREMRKVRLEEIAQATKIHLRCLKALESDNLDQLPGEVFIKGFIRSYSRAIGLDPDESILQLEDYLRETDGGQRQKKKGPFNVELGWQLRPIVWIVLALLVVLIAAYLFR